MNNDFVVNMSQAFAGRLESQAGLNAQQQVSLAYRLAYGRGAEEQAMKISVSFIQKHGLAAWCRVIFNSNELLYVR